MKKVEIISIVMFLMMLSVFSSCKHKQEVCEEEVLEVEIQVIDTVKSSRINAYVGEVVENMSLALNFPMGGTLQKLTVREGDRVREGQLLAAVDNGNALNAYNSAKATLQQAEDAYHRLKKVYEQGSVAEVKWVEMQTNLEKARSMEQIAKKQLDDCTLYAPMSGVVGQCNAEVGGQVLPQATVLTLLDMNQVFVEMSIPEDEVNSVKVGDKVLVEVPALKSKPRIGRVAERSVTSNRLAHSYQLKIALSNADGKLLPGMVSKVYLDQQSLQGFVIPAKAVQTRPEGYSVWVVENGKAQHRKVASTEFVGNGILVLEGLSQGDTVIVGGLQKLYDNARIKVLKVKD